MEINLGEHCSLKECRKLDYCPFKCDLCSLSFCKKHRTYEQHHCPHNRPNVISRACSFCGSFISAEESLIDKKVLEHTQSNECEDRKKERMSRRCNYPRCKKLELLPTNCDRCEKKFCLSHRLPSTHLCTVKPGGLRVQRSMVVVR
eukprot:TRINITY_DN10460_c0_g1_i1.p1 TRINITY_DN10460_c0_g1~~TRINITY_DN10460_c0_g1_i1.p1  ORF type:complete len:146 (-),score=13.18 TRINITY_DN10460_c0_g1_i1:83-520(-)